MKLRIPKRAKSVSSSFKDKPLSFSYFVHPTTKNLYLKGTYDNYPLIGFIFKGEKRGTIGSTVLDSDALHRRDVPGLALWVAAKCRFNGVPKSC